MRESSEGNVGSAQEGVFTTVWCRLEDTEQEMIEQRAELQREQSVDESGRGKGCG